MVCGWKDQPANAISDFHLVEIDQQAEGQVKQFQEAQELRLVNGENLFHGLACAETGQSRTLELC